MELPHEGPLSLLHQSCLVCFEEYEKETKSPGLLVEREMPLCVSSGMYVAMVDGQ